MVSISHRSLRDAAKCASAVVNVMQVLSACMLTLLVWNAGAQQKRDEEHPEGKWEVLNGCQLVTNAVVDGDSFRVTHKEREYSMNSFTGAS